MVMQWKTDMECFRMVVTEAEENMFPYFQQIIYFENLKLN